VYTPATKARQEERYLAQANIELQNIIKRTQAERDDLLRLMKDIQRNAQITLDKQSPVANGFCLVEIEAMARAAIAHMEAGTDE